MRPWAGVLLKARRVLGRPRSWGIWKTYSRCGRGSAEPETPFLVDIQQRVSRRTGRKSFSKVIGFTDFPMDSITLWCVDNTSSCRTDIEPKRPAPDCRCGVLLCVLSRLTRSVDKC